MGEKANKRCNNAARPSMRSANQPATGESTPVGSSATISFYIYFDDCCTSNAATSLPLGGIANYSSYNSTSGSVYRQ